MKLSTDQLLSCLAACATTNTIGLVAGISTKQFQSFKAIYEGKKRIPSYMFNFMRIAKTFNHDIDEIRIALNDVKGNEKPISAGELVLEKPQKIKGQVFVFTSAQNNTDVHTKFLASLESYCKHRDAELLIGQYIYNKNGFQNGVADANNIYFDPALLKYINTEILHITDGLIWCGDLNILPTNKNPLTGFETYTGTASSIIPHAKIALESVATPKNEACKFMYATGTITMHNYIQKKAGQLAQSEHCYGALVVEIDANGLWFARQIQTNDSGIFYDLDKCYYPNGTVLDSKITAINWGDIHAEKSNQGVLKSCFNILKEFEPEFQVFHDLYDQEARNHHNKQSGHFLAKMYYEKADSVEKNLRDTSYLLEDFYSYSSKSKMIIVESNHDLALKRFLDCNSYNFKLDPVNAITYLKLQTAIYEALENGDDINILQYGLSKFIGKELPDNIEFLTVDDSYIIRGIECGYHGHIGANGSRGNPNQFRKLNRAMNTGHTHSAGIKGGVYTAGVTGSLDMGYNQGASSWSHSHIITYPNGRRSIITMIKSDTGYKYRA